MATRVNPKERRLLEDFVDYLERRGNKSGWVIVEKPSYEGGVENKKKQSTLRPPKSKRQYVKFYLEWLEMGQDDLDIEIDRFLSKVKE
jgi:hypothetical protein